MKATYRFGAQAQVFHALVALNPAFGLCLVVELLDVQCSQLVQPDFAYVADDMLVDYPNMALTQPALLSILLTKVGEMLK